MGDSWFGLKEAFKERRGIQEGKRHSMRENTFKEGKSILVGNFFVRTKRFQ